MGDDAGSVEKTVTVDMIRDLEQQQQRGEDRPSNAFRVGGGNTIRMVDNETLINHIKVGTMARNKVAEDDSQEKKKMKVVRRRLNCS